MGTTSRRGSPGKLFVVATPIGNLDDLGARAVRVLRDADFVLCEDTRVSRRLLTRYGVDARLSSLHGYNEAQRVGRVVRRLLDGDTAALVSDAGTPTVSDPGRRLVSAAHEAGVELVSVPGASAVVTALAGSGMDADRFLFEGFLPPRRASRRKHLEALKRESRTLVFYEAPHRVAATLEDLALVFGGERLACLAKELTKVHECFVRDSLERLRQWLAADSGRRRGEFVIVVAGAERAGTSSVLSLTSLELLEVLVDYLPPRAAAEIVEKFGGGKRNRLYHSALEMAAKR